jgi:hypothetical protein
MMMQEKQKLIEWLLLLGVIFIHIVSHFVKGMSQQNLILSTGSILIACHITTSPSFIDFFFSFYNLTCSMQRVTSILIF